MPLTKRWSSRFKDISEYLANPPAIPPNPKLYHLQNPNSCLWMSENPKLQSCSEMIESDKIPVIFVHGMEYETPNDVIRDLVRPFEQQARLTISNYSNRYNYYFVCWNSSIVSSTNLSSIANLRRSIGLPLFILLAHRYWARFYTELEHRARGVADYMQPIYQQMLETRHGQPRPIVITHSLGGYIWSMVTNEILRTWHGCPDLAHWHSIQPGVAFDAYQRTGEFPLIAPNYAKSDATLKVWYSKLDLVLSTLYPAVKGRRAMGQVGAACQEPISQIDMTRFAREAHGIAKIAIDPRSMWVRIGNLIRQHIPQESMPISLTDRSAKVA